MTEHSGGPNVGSPWWRFRHSWGVRVVLLAMRRDPRCRRSDRVEAATLVSAMLLAILAIPVSVVVGIVVLHSSMATVHREAIDRHQVTTTVISSTSAGIAAPAVTKSNVTVQWRRSNGLLVSAGLAVAGEPKVGSHLAVWATNDGRVVSPPLTTSQAEGRAYAIAIGVALGVLSLIYLVLFTVRETLLRRRVRAWDAEWIEVGSRTWS